jgi:hypothetical protein
MVRPDEGMGSGRGYKMDVLSEVGCEKIRPYEGLEKRVDKKG